MAAAVGKSAIDNANHSDYRPTPQTRDTTMFDALVRKLAELLLIAEALHLCLTRSGRARSTP
jgi:hypothetical protein